MEQADREYFKQILMEKRNEIRNDLGVLESHSLNKTSADSSGDLIYSDHMSDLGSASIEREKAFMFASRDGAYLCQLEQAIQGHRYMGKDHTHAQTRIYPYVFPCVLYNILKIPIK